MKRHFSLSFPPKEKKEREDDRRCSRLGMVFFAQPLVFLMNPDSRSAEKQKKPHGGCQVNGRKVAKFLDR